MRAGKARNPNVPSLREQTSYFPVQKRALQNTPSVGGGIREVMIRPFSVFCVIGRIAFGPHVLATAARPNACRLLAMIPSPTQRWTPAGPRSEEHTSELQSRLHL